MTWTDGLLILMVVVSLVTIYEGRESRRQSLAAIHEVHLSLNSRLTEWMDSTRENALDTARAAHRQGISEGQETERRRGETSPRRDSGEGV